MSSHICLEFRNSLIQCHRSYTDKFRHSEKLIKLFKFPLNSSFSGSINVILKPIETDLS